MSAKIAELTPIANASVNTAVAVKPGALRSCRRANLKFWIMKTLVLFPLRCRPGPFWIQQIDGSRDQRSRTTDYGRQPITETVGVSRLRHLALGIIPRFTIHDSPITIHEPSVCPHASRFR